MNTNTNTTNKEEKNNSIINVVVNGMTASEGVKDVQERLEAVEKSAFNIALISAYSCGACIPAYKDNKGIEHGEAHLDKKDAFKQVDFIKLVGKSKATLSRWLGAMNLIIENGYFTDFATGVYPFSYDKIYDIFNNSEVFKGMLLSELMELSGSTLEKMIKDFKPKEEEKTEEKPSKETATDSDSKEEEKTEEKPSKETAILTYQGNNYTVNKAVFEKWLAENGTLTK
jgi:hypothetical protein